MPLSWEVLISDKPKLHFASPFVYTYMKFTECAPSLQIMYTRAKQVMLMHPKCRTVSSLLSTSYIRNFHFFSSPHHLAWSDINTPGYETLRTKGRDPRLY